MHELAVTEGILRVVLRHAAAAGGQAAPAADTLDRRKRK